MNAQEARAKADLINTQSSNSQYARAKERIDSYTNDGKYQCWFYEEMLDAVRLKLSQEGYTVGNNICDRDGWMVQIQWIG